MSESPKNWEEAAQNVVSEASKTLRNIRSVYIKEFTALVENVLLHTDSRPCMRLEADGDSVIVAVEDASHIPATITERAVGRYIPPSGLGIISVLCRMWGNAPTPTGKTVWAVLGPENRL